MRPRLAGLILSGSCCVISTRSGGFRYAKESGIDTVALAVLDELEGSTGSTRSATSFALPLLETPLTAVNEPVTYFTKTAKQLHILTDDESNNRGAGMAMMGFAGWFYPLMLHLLTSMSSRNGYGHRRKQYGFVCRRCWSASSSNAARKDD